MASLQVQGIRMLAEQEEPLDKIIRRTELAVDLNLVQSTG